MTEPTITTGPAMTPTAVAQLCEPSPKSAISKLPKGGTTLDFVGHAAVTRRLLEVDPFWNWEPVAFDADGLPKFDKNGGLWIRLTICGVTRMGYGEPQGGDAFDKNKGAIGNAIRNAAMRFGVALDLWSKDDISTTLATPPSPVTTEQLAEVAVLGNKLGKTGEELLASVRKAVKRNALASLSDLTEPEAAGLLAIMRKSVAQAEAKASEPAPEGVDTATGEVVELSEPTVSAQQLARIAQLRAELGLDEESFMDAVKAALKDDTITDIATISAKSADALISRMGKAAATRRGKAA